MKVDLIQTLTESLLLPWGVYDYWFGCRMGFTDFWVPSIRQVSLHSFKGPRAHNCPSYIEIQMCILLYFFVIAVFNYAILDIPITNVNYCWI